MKKTEVSQNGIKCVIQIPAACLMLYQTDYLTWIPSLVKLTTDETGDILVILMRLTTIVDVANKPPCLVYTNKIRVTSLKGYVLFEDSGRWFPRPHFCGKELNLAIGLSNFTWN